MNEISPAELSQRINGDKPPVLLDVREEWELAMASLEEAVHIPMGQIPDRLAELDGDREIAVMCHHGVRSRQVVAFLKQSGFAHVINVAGGIDAWSRDVDSGVPEY
ncbi:MAG: rhodanese-like domain-containing protein [Gammaproteobacteria bacterium]